MHISEILEMLRLIPEKEGVYALGRLARVPDDSVQLGISGASRACQVDGAL